MTWAAYNVCFCHVVIFGRVCRNLIVVFFLTAATREQSVDQSRNAVQNQPADAEAAEPAHVRAGHAGVRLQSGSPSCSFNAQSNMKSRG